MTNIKNRCVCCGKRFNNSLEKYQGKDGNSGNGNYCDKCSVKCDLLSTVRIKMGHINKINLNLQKELPEEKKKKLLNLLFKTKKKSIEILNRLKREYGVGIEYVLRGQNEIDEIVLSLQK